MTQEQRLTMRLHKYWSLIRKDFPMPNISHFNSAAVEDLWPYCFRVNISGGKEKVFKFDYMGDKIEALYGSDVTGQTARARAPEFPGMILYPKLIDVCQNGQPLSNDGHFFTHKGQLIKYRACLLPFGGKSGVTHIIVGLSYRAF